MRSARGAHSLRAFAKSTGVSLSAIWNIELAETKEPRDSTLIKLAPYTGHTLQQLKSIAAEAQLPEETRTYRTMEEIWPLVDGLPAEELARLVQRAAAKLGGIAW